jgi:putative ABC transport system permease protein
MSFWKSLFPKRAEEKQLDSELLFHIDELTEENIAAGMPPEEARRRAVLEFGGREQLKEELRDVYGVPILETLLANLKSAFRFIRKSPSFSMTVVLTLALGIGVNSAVFSAIDAILLRPLPFPDGDQLMVLKQHNLKTNSPQTRLSPTRLEDWNRLNDTFQAITGYYTEDESETSGVLPEKVTEAFVTPRFLQVWGMAPALGRDFAPEEEHFGGPDAILISDRFWRRRFGANPNAVGKKLHFGQRSVPIVGIMPASFLFPERDVDLWSPVPPDAPIAQRSREWTWYLAVGRLKPNVTLAQARANLDTVQKQLGVAFPKTDADLVVGIEPLKETTVGGARRSLWILFASVTLLLLIACTNIVALLLARATQRQHEVAVRFSLGAPRASIITQLLTETFVLALAGAGLGLLFAGGASNVFRALATDLPRVDEIHLDTRIVLYSLACSVLVTLLCGLFPAIRGTRRDLSNSLAQTSRSQVSSRTSMQWLLVGVQVALAVTLLGGAGLLLRSFQALGRVSPGFDPSHVLTFHVSGSYAETNDWKGLTQRIDRIVDSVRGIPGVEDAATAAALPGVPSHFQTELRFAEGQVDVERKMVTESRFVSPSYFATMRIPLLAGELCRGNSAMESKDQEIVVNRSFANTYLPGTTVIGRHLQLPGSVLLQQAAIRGIVGDAREEGLSRETGPTVYWCGDAAGGPSPFYLARIHGDPMALAETVRKTIHEIEPGRSVFDITPLEEHLSDSIADNRMRTVLLSFFAATAIALACVGLYGTLSYSVNLRQREVGLRLALGALRGQIVKQFLWQGLMVTLLGCAAGWALAAGFSRLLSGMLYGVSPSDPVTLLLVILLVLVVAVGASLLPALRAARVEPMQVLREE